MDKSTNDLLIYLGISIALYSIFMTTEVTYLFWMSGIGALFFSVNTIIQAYIITRKAFGK